MVDGWSKPFGSQTHRTSEWRQNINEVTLGVGLVPNIGLILRVSHKSEGSSVLSWIYDFLELLGWNCVPCQVTRSHGYGIIISIIANLKFEPIVLPIYV